MVFDDFEDPLGVSKLLKKLVLWVLFPMSIVGSGCVSMPPVALSQIIESDELSDRPEEGIHDSFFDRLCQHGE